MPRVFPENSRLPVRRRVVAASALFASLAGPFQAAAQDLPDERKVSAGVFTPVQASRGESAYKVNCVSCHNVTDYTGETFLLAWVSRTAFDIFDVIRSQMPEDNPGILAREEYVDIVAYIFSLNKYPAGDADLPVDDESLKKVRIDAPPPAGAAGSPGAVRRNHPRVARRSR